MATPQDADLIIKLYDLRRDETMRKARNFLIFEFFPQSGRDVQTLFADRERPERSAYFRQVTSYWDMVAAMVNHGAIDRELFFDTNGEFLAVWVKVGHIIEDLRGIFGPQYLGNLEKLIAQYPHAEQRLELMRARFQAIAERNAQK